MILKLILFIRIVYYTVIMYVVTHVIVFTLLPAGFIRMAFSPDSCHRLKERFGRLLFSIVGKQVRISGVENIGAGKNYIIVANYPSFHAGFTLMMIFPEAQMVVHEFISRVPFLGSYLKRAGILYAYRKGFRRTMREIDAGLGAREGKSIIILPEGKRTPDGQIKTFRRGFIYILRHSGLDLLPVTLRGFYQLKPKNRIYMDPDAEPEVIIQKPVDRDAIDSMSDSKLLETTLNLVSKDYKP